LFLAVVLKKIKNGKEILRKAKKKAAPKEKAKKKIRST
jgi:hypothetical protein